MKSKLCLMILLSASCSWACAEWVKLGSSAQFDFYVDPGTLNKSGATASVWTLNDFAEEQIGPSKEKYRSSKVYFEFNCQEKVARQAYLTRHFESMGGAGTLSSDSAFREWLPVKPGTAKAIIYAYACNGL